MVQPLVSVVTPSYRSARFIAETIESVKQQDYPRIEHIIVDGNSDDGTVEILKSYPHLVWVSEPDHGQSEALNKGFRLARGEILGWLNADDTYVPDAVSTAVHFLSDHPEADLVYSDQQIIDGTGHPVRRSPSRPFDLVTLFTENFIRQPTVFFRRQVLETLGGVDESLHYSMDREYWLRIGSTSNMQYNPGVISANFRFSEGTKTFENKPAFHTEWLTVLERTISDPGYANVPLAVKNRAIRQAQVRFCVATLEKAIDARDLGLFCSTLYRLVTENWVYMLSYPFVKLARQRRR